MSTRPAHPATDPAWPESAEGADPAQDFARVLAPALDGRRGWREPARWHPDARPPRLWLVAIALLAVHLLWLLALTAGMRPARQPATPAPISVRLVEIEESPAAEVAPRELPPLTVQAPPEGRAANSPAPARPAAPARPVASALPQAGAQEGVVASPAPRLYNPDGSLRVPHAAPATPRDPLAQGMQAAAELAARGHNVVRCRPTRFAGAWKPDESVGDEVARKYLGFIGLYNPHSAARTAERAAEATAACDGDSW